MSNVFLNAAIAIFNNEAQFSCHAIHDRIGHYWNSATHRYRLMFSPYPLAWYPPDHKPDIEWWNGANSVEYSEARIYALLLAHEMHKTNDI